MVTELGMVLLLTITIVGIPFAIYRVVRWSLFAEACMLEDLSASDSRSRRAGVRRIPRGTRAGTRRRGAEAGR